MAEAGAKVGSTCPSRLQYSHHRSSGAGGGGWSGSESEGVGAECVKASVHGASVITGLWFVNKDSRRSTTQ